MDSLLSRMQRSVLNASPGSNIDRHAKRVATVSRQTKGKGEEAVNGAALVVDKTHSLDKD